MKIQKSSAIRAEYADRADLYDFAAPYAPHFCCLQRSVERSPRNWTYDFIGSNFIAIEQSTSNGILVRCVLWNQGCRHPQNASISGFGIYLRYHLMKYHACVVTGYVSCVGFHMWYCKLVRVRRLWRAQNFR